MTTNSDRRGHELLPRELREKLPAIYSTQEDKDPIAQVKFFHALANWTWYATEYDGDDRFFGLVIGFEKELGYFSLSELEAIGADDKTIPVERDLYFKPAPLSQCS